MYPFPVTLQCVCPPHLFDADAISEGSISNTATEDKCQLAPEDAQTVVQQGH